MSVSNAVFYRYHGHHRLSYKFLVFTNSSNELFRISSIEIEVSIVIQLKIEVKSNGNERGTKNEKKLKSSRIIAHNTFLYTKELYHWIRHVLVSYFQV